MNDSKIVYRIFGSDSCKTCSKMKKAMDFYGFYYDFIDVDDDKNEALCDKFNVDDIPHIQALSEKTGEVHVQYVGYISPIAFFNLLASEADHDGADLNIKGVSQLYGPTGQKQSDCGCGETPAETEAERAARESGES
jgi:thioredoxin-related protein